MCYSGGSHPAIATRASRMMKMLCFIFISFIYSSFEALPLFHPSDDDVKGFGCKGFFDVFIL